MNISRLLDLVKKLNWSLPEPEQQEALSYLLKNMTCDDCEFIIQQDYKNTWHNATLLLQEIGYPKNQKALDSLIWLLQDLNWPGSKTAMKILETFPKTDLVIHLEKAINEAYNKSDHDWLFGLKYFINKKQLTVQDFSNHLIYNLLDFADY